jgi:hypothetical protein
MSQKTNLINFHHDVIEPSKQAPVFVLVYQSWHAGQQHWADRFHDLPVVLIDEMEIGQAWTNAWRVNRTPAMLRIEKGQTTLRVEGLLAPDELLALMRGGK